MTAQQVDLFDAETVCGCGRRYGVFTFVQTPLVGVQDVGERDFLELRTCACGSTMSRAVSMERAAWLRHQRAAKALDVALETRVGLCEAFAAERRAWSRRWAIMKSSYSAAQYEDGRRAA